MSSDESDIEIRSKLLSKRNKHIQNSPTEGLLRGNGNNNLPGNSREHVEKRTITKAGSQDDGKKLTTKAMVARALEDLKSRKGVSLYAIKKYLKENYEVNTERSNHVIKNSIKKAVEEGTVVQTKGTGASGSFKLVPGKLEKTSETKKQKINIDGNEKEKNPKRSEKLKENMKESSERSKMTSKKAVETKSEEKPVVKKRKIKKGSETDVQMKTVENVVKERKTRKKAKLLPSPVSKRSAIMKRKSIGSIIKPPKMKPKARP